MTRTLKALLLMGALLTASRPAAAGPTEDLWAALKSANYPAALKAIAAGADVKAADPAFGTPLVFAACWADAEVVKALIDAKSDVNFPAVANGNTPLMNAASWGHVDAVKLLLAAGANVKVRNKIGQTVLSVGIGSTKLEIMKLLVDAGADPLEKFQVGKFELTPFNSLVGAYAPKEKVANLKTIAAFLAKQNVVYPPRLANASESDFSPLAEMAKFLLDKGADANMKVVGPWATILFQATALNKAGIVVALIDAKADIEAKGKLFGGVKGRETYYEVTPIMMAAALGNNEMVEAYHKAGANLNFLGVQFHGTVSSESSGGAVTTTTLTTYEYNTALSLASDNGHPDTAALLKSWGALGPKEVKK